MNERMGRYTVRVDGWKDQLRDRSMSQSVDVLVAGGTMADMR